MPDDRAQTAEQARRLRASQQPEMLGERVEAAARGEDAPDEGEKTQTWRGLRRHTRG